MLNQCRNCFSDFIRNPLLTGKKILAGFLIGATVIFITNVYVLMMIFSSLMIILYMSEISRKLISRFLAVISITVVFTLLIHILNNTFMQGLSVVLQMTIISLCSCLFIATTSETDILSALDVFFNFLARLGINTRKISLAVLLTIRSISYITYQFNQIRDAQKARGLEKKTIALLMPLLIKIFKAANTISDALMARGFD
jgi:biotin transport system permease protein